MEPIKTETSYSSMTVRRSVEGSGVKVGLDTGVVVEVGLDCETDVAVGTGVVVSTEVGGVAVDSGAMLLSEHAVTSIVVVIRSAAREVLYITGHLLVCRYIQRCKV
jgi:hypothetical protein